MHYLVSESGRLCGRPKVLQPEKNPELYGDVSRVVKINYYPPGRVLDLLRGRYEEKVVPRETRFRGTMLDEKTFAVDVEEWDLPDERAAMREARRSGEEKG